MGLVVLADSVSLEGQLTPWSRSSDEGHTNTRHSCASCGNIIYGDSSASPGIWKLQAGLLEDTSGLHPGVHIWTCRKQGWVVLPEDATSYDTQPEDLSELLLWVTGFVMPKVSASVVLFSVSGPAINTVVMSLPSFVLHLF